MKASIAWALIAVLSASQSHGAELSSDCEGSGLLDDLVLETVTGGSDLPIVNGVEKTRVVLYEINAGEPVSSPAHVVIYVGRGVDSKCYLLHAQKDDGKPRADRDGGELGLGFGGALVDHAFGFVNSAEDATEIFIPVYDYPFAGDEDYRSRLVELELKQTSSGFDLRVVEGSR